MVEDDYRADFKPAKDSSESSGSSRVKAKRFMEEKGPEIARAAVTVGVLVLNAVTFCC
jgi:hypothetical protein